jgi:hypothetical protein
MGLLPMHGHSLAELASELDIVVRVFTRVKFSTSSAANN